MPTFRISWDTPDGEQSDWIEARDMCAALAESQEREWLARPDIARQLQHDLNYMRGMDSQQMSRSDAAKLRGAPQSLSKALLGFDL